MEAAGTAAAGVFCRPLGVGGASFLSHGLPGSLLTALWLDPSQPGVMFAASTLGGARLYRTTDGGANWQRSDTGITTGSSLQRVEGIVGETTLYAAGNSVWRSDDSGASWALIIPGDIVVGHAGALAHSSGTIDLAEVECLLESGDMSLAGIDLPAPAPGTALFILARLDGESDYGFSSEGCLEPPHGETATHEARELCEYK